MGKPVKDLKDNKEGERPKKQIVPVIRQSDTTEENEAFTKMVEDPLVYIKKKEQEQRHQVISNPMTMK